MKTRILVVLLLCGALALSTKWALDLKEASVEEQRASLLEFTGPGHAEAFLTGKIPPFAMSLGSNGFLVNLVLQDNGWWWVASPEQTMADQFWVHQWITLLTQPKLMRILKPDQWNPVGVETTCDVKLLGGENKTLSFKIYRLRTAPQHLFYELEDGSAVKVEVDTLPSWPCNMDGVRTNRLWPFENQAISTMTYQRGHTTRTWTLKDGKWNTDRPANTEFWKSFFKKWDQWGSKAFLDSQKVTGEPLAFWELTFHSGSRSRLELFQDTVHGWVARYRGGSIAQVLNEETILDCFPDNDP